MVCLITLLLLMRSLGQAALARSEVGRLEAIVRLLSERLAKSEANAAAAEVARRLAVSGVTVSGGMMEPKLNGVNAAASTQDGTNIVIFGDGNRLLSALAFAAFIVAVVWKIRGPNT
jgi:hypothetical protein